MRRTSGRSLVVLLCFAGLGVVAAPASAKSRLTAKITAEPQDVTRKVDAEFDFKTNAKQPDCRRDGMPYRRCRKSVKYSGLQAGKHTFKLRVRRGKHKLFVTRRWTVVPAPGLSGPYAPKVDPDPLPGPPAHRLIFDEEFNGTALNTAVWRPFDGPGHKGHGLRRSSQLSLDGQGHLVITATPVNGTTVSGAIANRGNFLYGRLVFRVKTQADPTGTTSGEVFTWPMVQSAPEHTENNVFSTGPTVNNHSVFNSYVHFGSRNLQKLFHQPSDPTQWHTMIMDWTPDRLDITRDGALVWSITERLFIPDVLHHVSIQLDALNDGMLSGPQQMQVDYVRIYQ